MYHSKKHFIKHILLVNYRINNILICAVCDLQYVLFAKIAYAVAYCYMFSVFKLDHYCSLCAASQAPGGGTITFWVGNVAFLCIMPC